MKKILISGFEPFGNDTINPSLEVVKLLEKKELNGGQIFTVQVPVVKNKSIDTVIKAIENIKPDIVVTLGQASGRMGITPERVAINVDDFRIPDNEGNKVIDKAIVENAPDAYFSTLPIKAMVKAMQDNSIPAQVSNTAGTFVCNHLFYGIQHYISQKELNIKHGFVHIPLIPEQANNASQATMPLELISEGLLIALQAILDNHKDIDFSAGMIC